MVFCGRRGGARPPRARKAFVWPVRRSSDAPPLPAPPAPPAPPAVLSLAVEGVTFVRTVADARRVARLMCLLPRDGRVVHAVDTEVDSLDLDSQSPVGNGRVLCASVFSGPDVDYGSGPRVWVDALGDGSPGGVTLGRAVLAALRPALEAPDVPKVWHNYGFDRHVLANAGVDCRGFHADTMHLARLLSPGRDKAGLGGYSLAALSRTLLPPSFSKRPLLDVFGRPRKKKNGEDSKVRELPPLAELHASPDAAVAAEWVRYSVLDAEVTWHLFQKLKAELSSPATARWAPDAPCFADEPRGAPRADRPPVLFDLYERVLRPFGEVLTDMERAGVAVRLPVIEAAGVAAAAEREAAIRRFTDWARDFTAQPDVRFLNVHSDQQKAALLFGLPKKDEDAAAAAAAATATAAAATATAEAANAAVPAATAGSGSGSGASVGADSAGTPPPVSAPPPAASAKRRRGKEVAAAAPTAAPAAAPAPAAAESSSVAAPPPPGGARRVVGRRVPSLVLAALESSEGGRAAPWGGAGAGGLLWAAAAPSLSAALLAAAPSWLRSRAVVSPGRRGVSTSSVALLPARWPGASAGAGTGAGTGAGAGAGAGAVEVSVVEAGAAGPAGPAAPDAPAGASASGSRGGKRRAGAAAAAAAGAAGPPPPPPPPPPPTPRRRRAIDVGGDGGAGGGGALAAPIGLGDSSDSDLEAVLARAASDCDNDDEGEGGDDFALDGGSDDEGGVGGADDGWAEAALTGHDGGLGGGGALGGWGSPRAAGPAEASPDSVDAAASGASAGALAADGGGGGGARGKATRARAGAGGGGGAGAGAATGGAAAAGASAATGTAPIVAAAVDAAPPAPAPAPSVDDGEEGESGGAPAADGDGGSGDGDGGSGDGDDGDGGGDDNGDGDDGDDGDASGGGAASDGDDDAPVVFSSAAAPSPPAAGAPAAAAPAAAPMGGYVPPPLAPGDERALESRFDADNEEGWVEPGKARARKKRSFAVRSLLLPVVERTPKGRPSATAGAIKKLLGRPVEAGPAYSHLVAHGCAPAAAREACVRIGDLLTISAIDTVLETFIEPLKAAAAADAHSRVHCSLNLNTETGRLSARRPNLQNQPSLERDRFKIRSAFVAPPGQALVVADYGQLELRVLAHLTGCASMIAAFRAGGDFHSRTAMGMYKHVRDAVDAGACLLEAPADEAAGAAGAAGATGSLATAPAPAPAPAPPRGGPPLLKDAFKEERRKAKILNFSIAYGKTAYGLSKDWGVSVAEAEATVAAWYADRPEVQAWQAATRASARRTGRVYTMLGRHRDLPGIHARRTAAGAERAAINTPIQGSAADIVTCAMVKLARDAELARLGFRLLLQVHDEVILEGPLAGADAARARVVDVMRAPFDAPLLVDLDVDAKVVQNWGAAK